MNSHHDSAALHHATRRHFFSRCALGLGSIALGSLLNGRRAIVVGDELELLSRLVSERIDRDTRVARGRAS